MNTQNKPDKRNNTVRIIAGVLAFLLALTMYSFLTTPFDKGFYVEPASNGKKQIALTFDDGPGKYTERLLDGLRERNIKVSFFLMGRKIEKRQEIVKTMHDDGHLVGCHTWSHIDFLKIVIVNIFPAIRDWRILTVCSAIGPYIIRRIVREIPGM